MSKSITTRLSFAKHFIKYFSSTQSTVLFLVLLDKFVSDTQAFSVLWSFCLSKVLIDWHNTLGRIQSCFWHSLLQYITLYTLHYYTFDKILLTGVTNLSFLIFLIVLCPFKTIFFSFPVQNLPYFCCSSYTVPANMICILNTPTFTIPTDIPL